jgi:hypothetical protein
MDILKITFAIYKRECGFPLKTIYKNNGGLPFFYRDKVLRIYIPGFTVILDWQNK